MTSDLTGKGKEANRRLKILDSQVRELQIILKNCSKYLSEALRELKNETKDDALKIAYEQLKEKPDTEEKLVGKHKGVVHDLPARIDFSYNGIPFYIDFTIIALDVGGLVNLEGRIAYGVHRPICFKDCIHPEKIPDWICCDRISRCDLFEDKPLSQFSVNRDGIIQSVGELDDRWVINVTKEDEKIKTAKELHCRTIDFILKDALDWVNENILP